MSKTDGLSGAGVAIVQPYEAGHMNSFSVAQKGQDPLDAVTVSGPGGDDDQALFARFCYGIFMDGGRPKGKK